MQTRKKHRLQQLRHWRVRKKVSGTGERPRMSVCFTGTHIYVQFIDDVAGKTLAAASTLKKGGEKLGANVKGAKTIGGAAAKAALDKGIKEGRMRANEAMRLLAEFEKGLDDQTYLTFE